MGSSAHSSQEWFIGNETVVIFGVTALLDENVDLLSFELLTQRQQNVFELSQHHGAILLFVVKLQALNEVLEGSLVLGVLHFTVQGEELFQFDVFFSLLLGTAQFLNHLEGWVEIQTSEAVTEIEQVHASLALKVIDVEGKLCPFNILIGQLGIHAKD